MTRTMNTETMFAALSLELAVDALTKGVKKGSVKHDAEVTAVMEELTAENWPGMVMIADFGDES